MTVLVAVAGETTSDRSLVAGAELAESFDEELVAVHVMPQQQYENTMVRQDVDVINWSSYPEYVRPRQSGSDSRGEQTIDEAQEAAASVARDVVRETLGEDAGATVQGRVGDPADEVVDEASRRDARYVVIGGRKRTPVGKAVFGSVTQSVLLNAGRPVVTVPPDIDDRAPSPSAPVVAAVDRSDRAARVVSEASRLAEAVDRPLHVVHVLPRGEADRSGGGASDAERQAEQIAAEAVGDIDGDVTPVGLVGDASPAIVEYAREVEASHVVAAGRSRSPVGKVLFGSVTQSILLSADRPVVSVMTAA